MELRGESVTFNQMDDAPNAGVCVLLIAEFMLDSVCHSWMRDSGNVISLGFEDINLVIYQCDLLKAEKSTSYAFSGINGGSVIGMYEHI